MTLKDVITLILRYFTKFGSFRGALRKIVHVRWCCKKRCCKQFAISSANEFVIPICRKMTSGPLWEKDWSINLVFVYNKLNVILCLFQFPSNVYILLQ